MDAFIFHLLQQVAPFTGAWIEMEYLEDYHRPDVMSHPSRVRGLKFWSWFPERSGFLVAPFTGAWIEIARLRPKRRQPELVAPFTGAWIEMFTAAWAWNRGHPVAPFTGAWIEIQ